MRPARAQPVVFFHLEDEEDRDRDAVTEFMKKYVKLWRNLFARYQNVSFAHKNQRDLTSFDHVAKREPILTIAELTKMLKEHEVFPQLINKQEL